MYCKMKDLYFYRSLLVTMLAYLVVLGVLTGFAACTGPAGLVIVFLLIIILLAYFYSGA